MNSEPRQPESADPLDVLLREQAEYVADEGFTARVMNSLPPRRRRRSWRAYILTFAFLLCGAIGLWAMPPLPLLVDLAHWGIQNPQLSLLLVFVPVLAALGAMGWLLYTLTTEEA